MLLKSTLESYLNRVLTEQELAFIQGIACLDDSSFQIILDIFCELHTEKFITSPNIVHFERDIIHSALFHLLHNEPNRPFESILTERIGQEFFACYVFVMDLGNTIFSKSLDNDNKSVF